MTDQRPTPPSSSSASTLPREGGGPTATFDALPLSPEMRQTLEDIGYTIPTPVQLAVWEPATRGVDAVVQARTGTGKTAAFGLPIIERIVRRSSAEAQVLVLCPTRELALQVAAELERLAARKAVRIAAVYGGAPMPRQVEAIAAGAQVVVGTPGRVLDHLRRGTLDPSAIRLLVLDEADEMLSMGFERELNAILDHLPEGRQTLLFSATVPPDIERIAKNKLRSPEFVTLSGDHVGALEIEHYVYFVRQDKMGALVRVLEVENPESAIIFCNTRDETEAVAHALSRQGFDADWLNGDLPQSEREKVMNATREGRLRFLIATDVAARGIDISHLTHVINYDFPQDAESYVHRTGRTGRAGHTGTAISLVTPHDIGALYILRLTYKIKPIERQIPTEGELKTRAEADLVAMLAEAFGPKGRHPDDLSLARRLLSHDDAEAIVAGLLREHLGARPTAQEEAAAARRAPKPARAEAAAPKGRAPTREEAPAAAAAIDGERIDRAGVAAAEVHDTDRPPPFGPPAQKARPPGEGRSRRRRRGGAEGRSAEAAAGARPPSPEPAPSRHADFVTWQPPEEEGDDQPIFGDRGAPAAPPVTARSNAPSDAATKERALRVAVTAGERRDGTEPRAHGASEPPAAVEAATSAPAGEYVELYVNVGRRDGARAADLSRVIVDAGGVDRADVTRIRVRERNSFVSVRRPSVERAIAALASATIAGKQVVAEIARGREATQ